MSTKPGPSRTVLLVVVGASPAAADRVPAGVDSASQAAVVAAPAVVVGVAEAAARAGRLPQPLNQS